jgi:mRNA-degrading endonuclease RelE of RelBE toxin-antitoxin system
MKDKKIQLDLNNPVFQESWLKLDKSERNRVTDTLKKLKQLTWDQAYRDQGIKWEKISSVKPPAGIAVIYSLRITQSRRAVAYRDGEIMRLLIIAPDHDATYGMK